MPEVIPPRPDVSLAEFFRRFPDERTARRFVERAAWRDGRRCHHCGGDRTVVASGRGQGRELYRCLACGRPFTITTNTLLHATKIPIRTWLLAAHLIVSAPNGMTSVHLATLIGVPQPTAWRMGNIIRQMMNRSLASRSIHTPEKDQENLPVGDVNAGDPIGGELGHLVSRLMDIAAEKASDGVYRRMTRQTYHRVTRRHKDLYHAEQDFRGIWRENGSAPPEGNLSRLNAFALLEEMFRHIKD